MAISGGPDSVALATALLRVAREPGRGWTVRLGHVNHGLRGTESDEDESFVREMARELDVDLEVARVDTSRYARDRHLSLEGAARQQRYAALGGMLRAWPGDVIATGHTRDDQAETVLLHLLRGSGIDGLAGMSAYRDGLVRPFLSVPRHTILQALEEAGRRYRIDRTNDDTRYTRNRIRHEVLPDLQTIQPAASEAIARAAGLLRTDKDYLDAEADAALACLDIRCPDASSFSVGAGAFRALHEALQSRILRRLSHRIAGSSDDLTEEHLRAMKEAIARASGPRVRVDGLPMALRLTADKGEFSLARTAEAPVEPLATVELAIPGTVELETGRLDAEIAEMPDRAARHRLITVAGPYHAYCDADALGPRLTVRSRRPGDRMQPIGNPGSRKLQDLLVDRKIPRAQRDRIPVVENRQQIVWLPGICLDRRVSVREDSRRVAYLRFQPFV